MFLWWVECVKASLVNICYGAAKSAGDCIQGHVGLHWTTRWLCWPVLCVSGRIPRLSFIQRSLYVGAVEKLLSPTTHRGTNSTDRWSRNTLRVVTARVFYILRGSLISPFIFNNSVETAAPFNVASDPRCSEPRNYSLKNVSTSCWNRTCDPWHQVLGAYPLSHQSSVRLKPTIGLKFQLCWGRIPLYIPLWMCGRSF